MDNRDRKQYAPATERNRQPILEVLQKVIPKEGNILEIASGTGEHACFFAPYFPNQQWIPSDPDRLLRLSIEAWREDCTGNNLQLPLDINVTLPDWDEKLDDSAIAVIIAINLIHISPWSACQGLMKGVGKLLHSGGILYLYGPYKQKGKHTAPSNEAFDQSLQFRNPAWGVRNLEDVVELAEKYQLILHQIISMPANNLSLIFHHL
ncbi:MAG: SAM-dependent methyltransferase [Snowella sp.]|nr:MAG: SAM-dependent methyltransferase [Snowella sp.]